MQDKKVFCIPRNIDEDKGKGTNYLMKKGAILVTEPEDILDALKINVRNHNKSISLNNDFLVTDKKEKLNTSKSKGNSKKKNDNKEQKEIDEEYIDVFNLIPYYPVTIEYLSQKSKLKISELNQKLLMLELEGVIKNMPGNNFVRV